MAPKIFQWKRSGTFRGLDVRLLLILFCVLNVKLAIKIPAVLMLYVIDPNLHFGLRLKKSRLPLFYPVMIGLTIVSATLNLHYESPGYLPVFTSALLFWICSLLLMHQAKRITEQQTAETIERTLSFFFIVNALVSAFQLLLIIKETGALNPFLYQGDHQKYFLGTGDYIRGVTGDNCTSNAILNVFGLFYFLHKSRPALTILCMAVLLFTASNLVNLLLTGLLFFTFLFRSDGNQRRVIAVCVMFLVFFVVQVSPQNSSYVLESFRNMLKLPPEPVPVQPRPGRITQYDDAALNPEERREKKATLYLDTLKLSLLPHSALAIALPDSLPRTANGRIRVMPDNIHTEPFQSLITTPPDQLPLVAFIGRHQAELPISGKPYAWSGTPGKMTGFRQTFKYLRAHPGKWIAGAGPGNFSSKLAFRTTGLGISGGFPASLVYIHPDFLANHLDVYLEHFSGRPGLHSISNSPFSAWDQLLAEYGLAGLAAMLLLYLGFFARRFRELSYGLPILAFTSLILVTDYWFENLSILILSEFLLFLGLRENDDSKLIKAVLHD